MIDIKIPNFWPSQEYFYKERKTKQNTKQKRKEKQNKENIKYHYYVNLNIYELWKMRNHKLFLKIGVREQF